MAGNFTGKSLASGKVPTAIGTLYTCPANTVAYVKPPNFYNSNAATQTVVLYVNRGATRYHLARFVLEQDEVGKTEESLVLAAGDYLEAVTTTLNAVDYFITGVEEV